MYVENGVHHYIIGQDTSSEPRTFRLESDPTKGFSSLLGLIDHYKQSKVKPADSIEVFDTSDKGV